MFRRSPRSRPTAGGGHGVPDDPDALNALGVMLKNQGRLDEAEFLLRRAAAAGDANAINNLGNVLEVRGDKPGAAMYWRQAAERGLPQAMCSLAMFLVTSGELAEADSWYRRAKGKAGGDPQLYGMLQLIGALLEHQRAAAGGQDHGGESQEDAGLAEGDPVDEEPADEEPADALTKLRLAYVATGDPATLGLALRLGRAAVADCPQGDERRPWMLGELCMLLRLAYEREPEPRLLAESIEAGQIGARETPPGHPGYPVLLSSLGNSLQDEFERTTDPRLLAEAAELYRAAIGRLPPDHAELPGMLTNLGNTMLRHARHRDDARLLDEAIVVYRRSQHLQPPGSMSQAVLQANLAGALMARCAHVPSLAVLSEAAGLLRGALAALPASHPARAGLKAQLGQCEQVREAAVKAAKNHFVRTDHPDSPASPSSTGACAEAATSAEVESAVAVFWEYESGAGDPALLSSAIGMLRKLCAGSLDPLARHVATHTLGTALISLFERTGDMAALDEGAGLLEWAAGMTEVPDEARLSSMANHAGLLALRATYTGDPADLERSVRLLRDILARTPADDPHRAGRVGSLAGGLHQLGMRSGDSGLVREAITVELEVLAKHADGDRAAARSNLGMRMMTLYSMTGEAPVLPRAVAECRRAVDDTPDWHLLYPRFQANLGSVLHARYLHTLDLRPAAGEDPAAASAAAADQAGERAHLANPAGLADLAAAADAARAAVAATPAGHPNLVERRSLLANVLRSRYLAEPSDPAALEELIQAAEAAAAVTPEGHYLWAGARVLHATALAGRAAGGGDPAGSGAAAREILGEVAGSALAPVSQRVAAARQLGTLEMAAGDPRGALTSLSLAVELLPRAAPRSLSRGDQERPLALLSGLASDAAACALAVGEEQRALELLEQGRGILLSQAVDNRGDLTELRDGSPRLAAEFERLRDLLDPAAASGDPREALVAGQQAAAAGTPADAGARAQWRHALAADWDALLREIRDLPGLDGFLRPPGTAGLAARCTGGPVVIVNVSRFRCDALVLTAGGLRVVPLPAVTAQEVAERARRFRDDVRTDMQTALDPRVPPGPAAAGIAATLGWLWDAICGPVLDGLDLAGTRDDGDQWPRLWWVPTGPLTFLPLHAAGHHHGDAGDQRTVLDRVISSYLPTVRSLPPAGSVTSPAGHAPRVLAVAMPSTPGAGSLPSAEAEARHLASLFPDTELLIGAEATRAAVIAALPDRAWAHFACHAGTSEDDAGACRLVLHDHRANPLTVRDIARLRTSRAGQAELAFLSACDTARGPVQLADEAVHVTGAFHMAGYAHVVGTLWSVGDRIAADVARGVYGDLAGPVPSADRAAAALHQVVRSIRERHRDRPVLWAAHIHVGH